MLDNGVVLGGLTCIDFCSQWVRTDCLAHAQSVDGPLTVRLGYSVPVQFMTAIGVAGGDAAGVLQ
jgi:hypothetical protein